MFPTVFYNARFQNQELTGVQRYAQGMASRFENRLTLLRPKSGLPPTVGHLWEQTILPVRSNSSLLWSPGNTGPLAKANQVVTIHDASTLDHPEWFSGTFATWYRFLLPRLAARVRKIITVSHYSKERLVAACGVPESKIAVVHNAIDTRFQPASAEAIEAFAGRHGWKRPYCLYLGSLEPRKNLAALLQAWRELAPPDHDLVLGGAPGHVFRDKCMGDLPPNVRLFGRASEIDLPVLLSGASCFIFPSLYEGFGFPPLEAMACGCAVLCSNATSLPEVCGPAFDESNPASKGTLLYFNPHEPNELIAQLGAMLAMSASSRKRLIRNGLEHSRLYDWDRCAAQTWAVIEELMS
jgi:glycosyltransferase involved in cell wall biosynthesis